MKSEKSKIVIIHESSTEKPDFLLHLHDLYHASIRQIFEPICEFIPREYFGVELFTANAVTYSRGILGVLLIGFLLKFEYLKLSFFLILFHDFLDHIDGVVAFVQKKNGKAKFDDSLYGAFIDAQVDKIVFVTLLWTNLMVKKSEQLNLFFILIPLLLIVLESSIFWIRTRNYFRKKHGVKREKDNKKKFSQKAVSEGKLKQKCETLGLAFFSLEWYWTGSILLCVAMKYGWTSLTHKL